LRDTKVFKAALAATLAVSAVGLSACAGTPVIFLDANASADEREGYVARAVANDLFEIRSSELALTRAQRPELREFAQMLITHHTQSQEQLWDAARASGMIRTQERVLPPPMQQMIDELQQASGADFDRLYLRQQVAAHEMALTLHRGYETEGDARPLRAAARSAIPIIQQHLEMARAWGLNLPPAEAP
jgi:putative membrane protein